MCQHAQNTRWHEQTHARPRRTSHVNGGDIQMVYNPISSYIIHGASVDCRCRVIYMLELTPLLFPPSPAAVSSNHPWNMLAVQPPADTCYALEPSACGLHSAVIH